VPDVDDANALRELVGALERYPSLFSLSYDAVALYGRDGTIVAGNEAARALVGGKLRGSHFARHMRSGELERAEANFEAALSGKTVEFETVFTHRDGEPINVIARVIPALVDDRIVGVFGIARDITLQRRAEASRDESRQEFRSLFEQHPDPITMVDANGRYEKLNAAAERILGYRSEEVAGRKVGEIFPPGAERDEVNSFVLDLIRAVKPTRYERTLVRKGGVRVSVEGTAVPIVHKKKVTGVFLMSRDVSDRKRMQEVLELQARRTRALYQLASEPGADPEDQAKRALAFGMKELGFESAFVVTVGGEALMIGRGLGAELVDADNPAFRQLFREAIEGSLLFDADKAAPLRRAFIAVPLDAQSGRYGAIGFASRSASVALTDLDCEFVRAVADLAAVSIERAIEEKRLHDLAHLDALTGLPNRLLLGDRFKQAIANAKRRGEEVAVYFIDVDKFKLINDTYGHLVGDEVLRTVAKRLLESCRASDTVARLGGDEFIVLQSGPSIGAQSRALAARMRAELEAPCDIESLQLSLSVGIGISVFPLDGRDEEALLKNADAALYAAKACGAGSVRRFGVELSAAQLALGLER
jgi:diguanylate cyclase (GGDEF)-like protein/PAS domain S-box-containing protein